MIFELQDISGKTFVVENVVSYELSSEAGAACDGLRINFVSPETVGEICIVRAYSNGKLVFNGFCDCQRLTFDQSGRKCFIYARSSASVLVDNEAFPRQYNCPSAQQLWYSNARDFGFDCDLPEICTENSYLVSKGTSCYGAINDFVSAVYGAPVYVTPENVLKVYELSAKVKRLDGYGVISLSRVISRSEPISDIDYKISSADSYSYHFKSNFARDMGIRRRRLCNLSAIPLWQRELTAEKKITDSLADYYSVEAVIAGECDLGVFDRVEVSLGDNGASEEFFVCEAVRSKNGSGEKTTLVLKKSIDGGLINYVA